MMVRSAAAIRIEKRQVAAHTGAEKKQRYQ